MKNSLDKCMLATGISITILTLVLLLGHSLLPVSLVKVTPIIIAVMLGVFLVFAILKLLFAKQIIAKFAALPLVLSGGVIFYFLIELPIYPILMSSMTGQDYSIDSDAMFETMRVGFLVLQFGIWITIIPIVIASIVMASKSGTKSPKNIEEYYPLKAKVISNDYTNVRINNVAVYRLELEVQHYEGAYRIHKDIRDVSYRVLSYSKGDYIEVLVDPDKKKKVVIENDGIFL